MPWVCAVGGAAHVSWYDLRFAGAGSNDLTDFFRGSASVSGASLVSGPEVRLTDASFDLRQAPQLVGAGGPEGFFLGDSMGLASAGKDFLALFSQPHDSDPASVFARRTEP